jgi:cytidylate kinase
MYRAITLYFLRNSVALSNQHAIEAALQNIELHFEINSTTKQSEIFLNGENVAHLIRELLVADKVSEVAAIKEVRHFAVAQQQVMGAKKGIVMDGRDIGTVVFPKAELKIFMTADPETRVLRRFDELYAINPHISIDEVRHNLELRDYIDSNRAESPLRQAEDARVLDNTHLDREQQFALVLEWVNHCLSN